MPTVRCIESTISQFTTKRLSASKSLDETFRDINVDKSDSEASIEFYAASEPNPEGFLSWLFDDLGQSRLPPTRFTSGAFAVLYTALEVETAVAEITSHLDQPADGSAMYFRLLEIGYEGETLDVRARNVEFPFLTKPDSSSYQECTIFAEEAINAQIDAICTTSARRQEGSCLPIFRRSAITTLTPATHLRFNFDESGKQWKCRAV